MGRPKGSKNKVKRIVPGEVDTTKVEEIKAKVEEIKDKPVEIDKSVDPLVFHKGDKTYRCTEIRRDACEYLIGVNDIYSGFFEYDCNGIQCHNEKDWCPIRDTKPWYTPQIHPTKRFFGAKK